MSKFVPTTAQISGNPHWVNLDRVIFMRRITEKERGDTVRYTVLQFADSTMTFVKETPEEILALGGT